MNELRIAFATCVKLGLSCIEEIYRIGGHLDLMITLKDDYLPNKSGRIYLDDISAKHNVDLLKIRNINEEVVINKLKEKKIDWLFIIGWSQIAKKELLETPKYGCIGMHPMLLPKGRGRAAIPWAILKGLSETGVTMFKLDEGVDTGDIIGQGVIPLSANTTATELYEAVNNMHIELISNYWNDIVLNRVSLIKQNNDLATYWEERKPSDGLINTGMSVYEAETYVRALTHPYPGAFLINDGHKIIIWTAHISQESVTNSIKFRDGYLVLDNFEVEECH